MDLRRLGDCEGYRGAGPRSQYAGLRLNTARGADADRQFADPTHRSEYGTAVQAKCIVFGIKQANLPRAKFIIDDFGGFEPKLPEPLPAN